MFPSMSNTIEYIYPGAQTTVASSKVLAVAVAITVRTSAATLAAEAVATSSSSSTSTTIIRRLSANNTQTFYEEFTLSLSHHIFAEERWFDNARCLNGSSLYTRQLTIPFPIHHYSMQTLSPVFRNFLSFHCFAICYFYCHSFFFSFFTTLLLLLALQLLFDSRLSKQKTKE